MIDNSPRIILVSSDFIVSSLRRLPIWAKYTILEGKRLVHHLLKNIMELLL
jgi:hypothetical protein